MTAAGINDGIIASVKSYTYLTIIVVVSASVKPIVGAGNGKIIAVDFSAAGSRSLL